jgi:hypothetical protein
MAEDDDLRLTKVRIALGGLLFAQQKIPHECRDIHLHGRRTFIERRRGDTGEFAQREIVLLPPF